MAEMLNMLLGDLPALLGLLNYRGGGLPPFGLRGSQRGTHRPLGRPLARPGLGHARPIEVHRLDVRGADRHVAAACSGGRDRHEARERREVGRGARDTSDVADPGAEYGRTRDGRYCRDTARGECVGALLTLDEHDRYVRSVRVGIGKRVALRERETRHRTTKPLRPSGRRHHIRLPPSARSIRTCSAMTAPGIAQHVDRLTPWLARVALRERHPEAPSGADVKQSARGVFGRSLVHLQPTMATEAATRARLRAFGTRQRGSYRQLAKRLHAATGGGRWSHVLLRRFERGTARLSVAELRHLEVALTDPPTDRKRDRRLDDRLDESRAVVEARDPWLGLARAAAEYAETRAGMETDENRRAWRVQERRYREWGRRDADGRMTNPDALLTLDQAINRLIGPYDGADGTPNTATTLKRFVQRRITAGVIDDAPRIQTPQLARFRAARERMLGERDILVGPPSPIEMLCDELARTARWAHTVESQERDAPAQAERRRRAEQQNGRARLIMGTPA